MPKLRRTSSLPDNFSENNASAAEQESTISFLVKDSKQLSNNILPHIVGKEAQSNALALVTPDGEDTESFLKESISLLSPLITSTGDSNQGKRVSVTFRRHSHVSWKDLPTGDNPDKGQVSEWATHTVKFEIEDDEETVDDTLLSGSPENSSSEQTSNSDSEYTTFERQSPSCEANSKSHLAIYASPSDIQTSEITCGDSTDSDSQSAALYSNRMAFTEPLNPKYRSHRKSDASSENYPIRQIPDIQIHLPNDENESDESRRSSIRSESDFHDRHEASSDIYDNVSSTDYHSPSDVEPSASNSYSSIMSLPDLNAFMGTPSSPTSPTPRSPVTKSVPKKKPDQKVNDISSERKSHTQVTGQSTPERRSSFLTSSVASDKQRRKSITDISKFMEPRKSIVEMTPAMQARISLFESQGVSNEDQESTEALDKPSMERMKVEEIPTRERRRSIRAEVLELERRYLSKDETSDADYNKSDREENQALKRRRSIREDILNYERRASVTDDTSEPSRRRSRDGTESPRRRSRDGTESPRRKSRAGTESPRRRSRDGTESPRRRSIRSDNSENDYDKADPENQISIKKKIMELERRKSITERRQLSEYDSDEEKFQSDEERWERRRLSSNAATTGSERKASIESGLYSNMTEILMLPQNRNKSFEGSNEVTSKEARKKSLADKMAIPEIQVQTFGTSDEENTEADQSEDNYLKSIAPYLKYRKSISELEPYLQYQSDASQLNAKLQDELARNENVSEDLIKESEEEGSSAESELETQWIVNEIAPNLGYRKSISDVIPELDMQKITKKARNDDSEPMLLAYTTNSSQQDDEESKMKGTISTDSRRSSRSSISGENRRKSSHGTNLLEDVDPEPDINSSNNSRLYQHRKSIGMEVLEFISRRLSATPLPDDEKDLASLTTPNSELDEEDNASQNRSSRSSLSIDYKQKSPRNSFSSEEVRRLSRNSLNTEESPRSQRSSINADNNQDFLNPHNVTDRRKSIGLEVLDFISRRLSSATEPDDLETGSSNLQDESNDQEAYRETEYLQEPRKSPRGSISAEGARKSPRGSITTEARLSPRGSFSEGTHNSPRRSISIEDARKSPRGSISVEGTHRSPRGSISVEERRSSRGSTSPKESISVEEAHRSPRGSISVEETHKSPRGSISREERRPSKASTSPRGSISIEETHRSPRGSISEKERRPSRESASAGGSMFTVEDRRSSRGSVASTEGRRPSKSFVPEIRYPSSDDEDEQQRSHSPTESGRESGVAKDERRPSIGMEVLGFLSRRLSGGQTQESGNDGGNSLTEMDYQESSSRSPRGSFSVEARKSPRGSISIEEARKSPRGSISIEEARKSPRGSISIEEARKSPRGSLSIEEARKSPRGSISIEEARKSPRGSISIEEAHRSPRGSISVEKPHRSSRGSISVEDRRYSGGSASEEVAQIVEPGISNDERRPSIGMEVLGFLSRRLSGGQTQENGNEVDYNSLDDTDYQENSSRSARGSFSAEERRSSIEPQSTVEARKSPRGSISKEEVHRSPRGSMSVEKPHQSPRGSIYEEDRRYLGGSASQRGSVSVEEAHRSPRASISVEESRRSSRGSTSGEERRPSRGSIAVDEARMSPRGSISVEEARRSPRGSISVEEVRRSPRGSISVEEARRSPRGSISVEERRHSRGSVSAERADRSPRGSISVEDTHRSPRGSISRESLSADEARKSSRGSVFIEEDRRSSRGSVVSTEERRSSQNFTPYMNIPEIRYTSSNDDYEQQRSESPTESGQENDVAKDERRPSIGMEVLGFLTRRFSSDQTNESENVESNNVPSDSEYQEHYSGVEKASKSPRGSISSGEHRRSPRGSMSVDEGRKSPRGSISVDAGRKSPRGSISVDDGRKSPRGSISVDAGQKSPRGSISADGGKTSPRGSISVDEGRKSPRGSISVGESRKSPRGSIYDDEEIKYSKNNTAYENVPQIRYPSSEEEGEENIYVSPRETNEEGTVPNEPRRKSFGMGVVEFLARRFSGVEEKPSNDMPTDIHSEVEKDNLTTDEIIQFDQRRVSTSMDALDFMVRRFSSEPIPDHQSKDTNYADGDTHDVVNSSSRSPRGSISREQARKSPRTSVSDREMISVDDRRGSRRSSISDEDDYRSPRGSVSGENSRRSPRGSISVDEDRRSQRGSISGDNDSRSNRESIHIEDGRRSHRGSMHVEDDRRSHRGSIHVEDDRRSHRGSISVEDDKRSRRGSASSEGRRSRRNSASDGYNKSQRSSAYIEDYHVESNRSPRGSISLGEGHRTPRESISVEDGRKSPRELLSAEMEQSSPRITSPNGSRRSSRGSISTEGGNRSRSGSINLQESVLQAEPQVLYPTSESDSESNEMAHGEYTMTSEKIKSSPNVVLERYVRKSFSEETPEITDLGSDSDSESEFSFDWTINEMDSGTQSPVTIIENQISPKKKMPLNEIPIIAGVKIQDNKEPDLYEALYGHIITILTLPELGGEAYEVCATFVPDVTLESSITDSEWIEVSQKNTNIAGKSLLGFTMPALSPYDTTGGWTTMDALQANKKKKPIENINTVLFCGCGFLGGYLVGAATYLQSHAPHLLRGRVAGSSVGSLIAACIVCDIPLEYVRKNILATAQVSQKYFMGPFNPFFPIEEPLLKNLLKMIPEDGHIRASGRLFLSLTRATTLTNEIVSEYSSREELIRAILCCCFLPFISGFTVPTFQGRRYIDGGMSNNMPMKGNQTLSINAFSGDFDICPTDPDGNNRPLASAFNQSIKMTNVNLVRLVHALIPPKPEDLDKHYELGYNDAQLYYPPQFSKMRNL